MCVCVFETRIQSRSCQNLYSVHEEGRGQQQPFLGRNFSSERSRPMPSYLKPNFGIVDSPPPPSSSFGDPSQPIFPYNDPLTKIVRKIHFSNPVSMF